jgi:hypothetical protein
VTEVDHGVPEHGAQQRVPEHGGQQRAARPVVVYIAGSGRSGSTLLERILGTLPGVVNVGEVNDLFRRVLRFDERCGCGEPISSCAFWTAVGARALGGWSDELVDEMLGLQRQVARQRHLGRLMTPRLRDDAFQTALRRFSDVHARIYQAVLAESGGDIVVDASKGAAQALAAAGGGGVDLRLLHLVRDPRGVAFSWAKPDVHRPHGDGPRATMHSFRPQDTAARWALLQGEIATVRRRVDGYALLRYEDLVARPAEAVERAVTALGLELPATAFDHLMGETVELPVSHGLSGNPSRFRSGPVRLRLDEQWRREMSRWDRMSTTAIALAPLSRYGYLRPTADGSRR